MIIFLLGIIIAFFLLVAIVLTTKYMQARAITKMRKEYLDSLQNSYDEDLFLQDLAFNKDIDNQTIVHYHNTVQ